jgi:hypothetical protein
MQHPSVTLVILAASISMIRNQFKDDHEAGIPEALVDQTIAQLDKLFNDTIAVSHVMQDMGL